MTSSAQSGQNPAACSRDILFKARLLIQPVCLRLRHVPSSHRYLCEELSKVEVLILVHFSNEVEGSLSLRFSREFRSNP